MPETKALYEFWRLAKKLCKFPTRKMGIRPPEEPVDESVLRILPKSMPPLGSQLHKVPMGRVGLRMWLGRHFRGVKRIMLHFV